jgi:hypothetical protein
MPYLFLASTTALAVHEGTVDQPWQLLLSAGVAGVVVILAVTGFIFFRPERDNLLHTQRLQQDTIDRYISIHEERTLPTLVQALSQLQSVSTALEAVTAGLSELIRSSNDLGDRIAALERKVGDR